MRSTFPPSTWLLLSLVTVSSAGFGASGLETLERAVQESVSDGCLSARQSRGAAAYRRCVTSLAGRIAERPPLASALDFDERVALDARCAGSGAFEGCVLDELAAIDGDRKPYLAYLDADERHALVEQCLDAGDANGLQGYRRCLGDGLDALETLPPANLSSLALADRAALARRCGEDTSEVVGYRRCLLEANGVTMPDGTSSSRPLDAADVPAPGPALDTGAPATEPAFDTAATEADSEADSVGVTGQADADLAVDSDGILSREDGPASTSDAPAVDAAPPSGTAGTPVQADTPAVDSERERIVADLEERLRDARARLEASVATLDGTDRALLAAALALPFLLLVARTAIRGRGRGSRLPETTGAAFSGASTSGMALAERVAPSLRAHERCAESGDALDGEAHGVTSDVPPTAQRFVPRSAFGRWLLAESSSLRRQHAIEFLVYWMAYGDDRYDLHSRRALLERSADDDLDAHDRIRRHVLERDTAAFADALRWLQRNTGAVERMQIIDLLMALLVTDGAMTPVQNTLLRFVADAFGIPAETLDERHEFAFDAPMPPLPRPDLPIWWESVDSALPIRWNARALATLDEREQYRVRLGLPLGAGVAERRVIEGYRRAARRCQPHRFDALGDRERALVARRLAKYEEARDALLDSATA